MTTNGNTLIEWWNCYSSSLIVWWCEMAKPPPSLLPTRKKTNTKYWVATKTTAHLGFLGCCGAGRAFVDDTRWQGGGATVNEGESLCAMAHDTHTARAPTLYGSKIACEAAPPR